MLKIYVCGPTVYNDVHIGNMRPILSFDFIMKAHRFLGHEYKFINNITDIDDKIINRAKDENVSETVISEKYTAGYLELLEQLSIDTITHIEKVTDNIDEIERYIAFLVKKESAYVDGVNVWFDVKKNINFYGEVSGQKLSKMEFSEQSNLKRFEADFALWKDTVDGVKYPSRFGHGRPGWHTECVALINKHFGSEGVDIHGGGTDLTFPHHENENIQHRALFGKPLAKKWLRCGQIMFKGEKMSKSLGNIIWAKDFIKEHGSEVFRTIILNTNMLAPVDINDSILNNAKNTVNKYKKLIFSFITKYQDNFIDNPLLTNEDKEICEIINPLTDHNFSEFNFRFNGLIKKYNISPSILIAKQIYTILNIILPKLAVLQPYLKQLPTYFEWQNMVLSKNYEAADILRSKLMELNLI
ncbi:class I tRNA ligase family protein [Mycoplasmopsis opalescens]|uniref:class I tRNA ligase family protein n=1 Tax=Mycoplasmopsis opalescens TaxID=114886 RepID=UPI0004A6D1C9|nr:class I tRNA ligase family protein [Mycoplasmopsis opalescens]